MAAPQSGSGKTLVTLGLARAFVGRGLTVAPAKTGPDYIDPAFLSRAARNPCVNLDAWAMSASRLHGLAGAHAAAADLLLVEGVMGLFDGSVAGTGSSADLAEALGLPVLLVVDCRRMGQTVAAIAEGLARHRAGVEVVGVVLNNVASDRHEAMLRVALQNAGIACLGALRRNAALAVPDRHLGLVLPGEVEQVDALIDRAADAVAAALDLDAVLVLAASLAPGRPAEALPPLGQHTAIARDAAFAFVYEHWLTGWRNAGATLSFFSPLADEPPDARADAVFLPGGYPELHADALAAARDFADGLTAARERGALIYGECGGYMVLGRSLTAGDGSRHAMTGLLPVETRFDIPGRTLGYRRLTHRGPLPWPEGLTGHEFHYASESAGDGATLFVAADAAGRQLPPIGAVQGRVCGSWAHVIDRADGA